MKKTLTWILLLLICALCGCTGAGEEAETNDNLSLVPALEEGQTETPLADYPEAIVGEWNQANIDSDSDAGGQYAFTAQGAFTFSASGMSSMSGTYRFDGQTLVLRDKSTKQLTKYTIVIRDWYLYLVSQSGVVTPYANDAKLEAKTAAEAGAASAAPGAAAAETTLSPSPAATENAKE